ncbi:unnamed protein product, partial [Porites lobata]
MVASGKKTHKTVCLKINPRRSPRGFISVLLAVVCYQGRISPAESDGHLLIYHLFNSLTAAEAKLTNDHYTIIVKRKKRVPQPAHQENHQIRDIRDTYKARLTRYFANIGWQCVTNQPIYEEKLQ